MSAGVQPEGFGDYMLDVRDASIHAVQTLGGYDDKVMLPALMMAIVSVVKLYVDMGRMPSMDFGMNIVHEGMDALAGDYKKEMLDGN